MAKKGVDIARGVELVRIVGMTFEKPRRKTAAQEDAEKPHVCCPFCLAGIAYHHFTAEGKKWRVYCQACGNYFWITREVRKK